MTDVTPLIQDVVPQGTPNTVLMPVTGHVLSLPAPFDGAPGAANEGFASYCWRVHKQCMWPDNADDRGSIMFNTGAIFSLAGAAYDDHDRSNWPLVADQHYNRVAYMTPDEKAAFDKSQAEWNAAEAKIGQQDQAPSAQAHKAQLLAHAHAAVHARKGGKLAVSTVATGTVSTPAPAPADGPPVAQG